MKSLESLRSILFVPADRSDFISKAPSRGADAIILDLEDGVADANKEVAREHLQPVAETLAAQGLTVFVRINSEPQLAELDLVASIDANTSAVVVPKVESTEELQLLSNKLSEIEKRRGLDEGHTRLVAFIESPTALNRVFDIAAASPRLVGLSLGTEDFCDAIGAVPNRDTLYFPCQQIVLAAHSAGIQPLGFVGSIADFSDMTAFAHTVRLSRNMGFRGACCIHPKQVAVLNEGFSPSAGEIEDAQAVVSLFEEAQQQRRGAVAYKGQMIDAPVYSRALTILERVTMSS